MSEVLTRSAHCGRDPDALRLMYRERVLLNVYPLGDLRSTILAIGGSSVVLVACVWSLARSGGLSRERIDTLTLVRRALVRGSAPTRTPCRAGWLYRHIEMVLLRRCDYDPSQWPGHVMLFEALSSDREHAARDLVNRPAETAAATR